MIEAPRIKICGLREPEHGALAGELGVWAIGLMFAERSPRLVDPDRAREIVAATPAGVHRVGVFVDASPERIAAIATSVGLTYVQIHGPGDIPAIRGATGLPIIAGFGVETAADLDVADASPADLVLLDAKVAGEDGGTGRRFDWSLLAARRPRRPFLLAGGLGPDNVADAITQAAPWGVDVSSGVESSRGVKDSGLIGAFVAAVRARVANDDGSGG